MNEKERLSALNEMERQEAYIQNREPAEVISRDMESYEGGSYNHDTNTISINSDHISNDEAYDAHRAYYHESRHAYQHEQAKNPAEANNPEQAQEWKENHANYITPEQDYDGYKNQPVEKDANEYATTRMHEYNEAQGVSFAAQVEKENQTIDTSQSIDTGISQ